MSSGNRVLIIGRHGQLALSLAERATSHGIELDFLARPQIDLLDLDGLAKAIEESGAKIIVNAAAHTAVDQAESEPEIAERINATAAGVMAASAKRSGARLIHISTDYVFDGSSAEPYPEDGITGPLGVYGRTKLAGEEAVRAACLDHLIVRTAWVYSPFGGNFLKTMLTLARSRDSLTVVDDQIGNPTSALDLADAIFAAILRWRSDPDRGLGETVHVAGTGSTSWAGFARHIFSISAAAGGPSAAVTGIPSSDWPTKAVRPLNSRLNSTKFAGLFGYRPPHWEQSSAETVRRLLAANH